MVESTMNEKILVLDCGSNSIKAGFAGEDSPRCEVPTVLGRSNQTSIMSKVIKPKPAAGQEAIDNRTGLQLKYPIRNGQIENWPEFEEILSHVCLEVLATEPAECSGVFVTEPTGTNKYHRERLAAILFDKFSAQQLYIADQAVMSMYSAGRVTGVSVDSGKGLTHSVAVYEGQVVPDDICEAERSEVAGASMNEYLQRLLQEKSGASPPIEVIEDIKERLCFTAMKFKDEYPPRQYSLPDKKVINIPGTIQISIPELLFKPALNNIKSKSLHTMVWSSISFDNELRREMGRNILLSGGSSLFEGLSERLHAELLSLAPAGTDIRILFNTNKKNSVWNGA